MTKSSEARQIEKAYEILKGGDFVRIMDIVNMIDLSAAQLKAGMTELYRAGWTVIPNSQGGDVTDEERRYCPSIGAKQVHLIAR